MIKLSFRLHVLIFNVYIFEFLNKLNFELPLAKPYKFPVVGARELSLEQSLFKLNPLLFFLFLSSRLRGDFGQSARTPREARADSATHARGREMANFVFAMANIEN